MYMCVCMYFLLNMKYLESSLSPIKHCQSCFHHHTGQISQNESLFTYADGQNVTTFANPNHVPVFLDEVVANTAPEIVQSCNNDPMCIFDYNQTGDANVGMATLTTNQNNNNDQMQACEYRDGNLVYHTTLVTLPIPHVHFT